MNDYEEDRREYRRDSGRRRKRIPARMRDHQGIIDWVGDVVFIVLIILVIMFCISWAPRAYNIGYSIFHQESVDPSGEGTEVEVTITPGMSVNQIGQMLQEKGLLKDGAVFQYQERFSSWHGKIVPGTYTLSTDMTPDDMLKIMAADYDDSADTSGTESGSGTSAADTADSSGDSTSSDQADAAAQ